MDLLSLSSSHKWFSWSGTLGSSSARQPLEAAAPGNGLMGVKKAVKPSQSLSRVVRDVRVLNGCDLT